MEEEKELSLLKDGERKVIGNYVFEKEHRDDGHWLVLRGVAGGWQVCWRDDVLMYGVLLSLLGNEAAEEYIHCLCTMISIATAYPHDLVSLHNGGGLPLMDGFCRLIKEQNDYEQSLKPAVSADEDERALKDTVEFERLKEDLSEIYPDGHGEGEVQS